MDHQDLVMALTTRSLMGVRIPLACRLDLLTVAARGAPSFGMIVPEDPSLPLSKRRRLDIMSSEPEIAERRSHSSQLVPSPATALP